MRPVNFLGCAALSSGRGNTATGSNFGFAFFLGVSKATIATEDAIILDIAAAPPTSHHSRALARSASALF
jgi:hypothetical protein